MAGLTQEQADRFSEAERRQLLTPEQQARWTEAKNRGLAPGYGPTPKSTSDSFLRGVRGVVSSRAGAEFAGSLAGSALGFPLGPPGVAANKGQIEGN